MRKLSIMELHPFGKWAGPESHVYDLTQGLIKQGHAVCVAANETNGIEKFESICPVYKFNLKRPHRLEIKYVRKLANIIKKHNIDIVHTHGSWNSWIALFATMLAGRGKVVNTWHGLRKAGNDFAHRWFYNKIAAIISVSDMLKRRIVDNTYIDSSKIHVVHNGIDIEKFSVIKEDMRQKYDISKENFIVGFFGRIHPEKGIEYLVKAMGVLKEQNKDVTLFLVGDTDDAKYKDKIQKIIECYEIKDKIKFCGFIADVSSYMNAIDVLVLPSVCQESCPLVLGEAMSCSKPIITTALGAQAEIVQDELNGFIIPAFSEQAIADKLMTLAIDRELCLKMGQNGRKIVEEKFSLEVMGKKTADIFYNVLSNI